MEEINIQRDIKRFIHDVLTDEQTKSNPELIAAVTGLLGQAYALGVVQQPNINDVLMDGHQLWPSEYNDESNSELETFEEYIAKEQWRKYISSIERRIIQKSKY